jgi:hypothetical protein
MLMNINFPWLHQPNGRNWKTKCADRRNPNKVPGTGTDWTHERVNANRAISYSHPVQSNHADWRHKKAQTAFSLPTQKSSVSSALTKGNCFQTGKPSSWLLNHRSKGGFYVSQLFHLFFSDVFLFYSHRLFPRQAS